MSADVLLMAAQSLQSIMQAVPTPGAGSTVLAHAVSDPQVHVMAQELDLSNVNARDSLKISIRFSESQRVFMRNVGIAILFLWFCFFVAKLAIPGKGGAGGQMIQKIGGWGGLIVAGVLCMGLIAPNVMIDIINAMLWLAGFVWGLLSTLWK